MRTRLVVLLAAALVAGCGGSGDQAASPSRSPSPVPSVAPSASPTLAPQLLAASDVGSDWKSGEPINAEDLAAVAQLPCEAAMNPRIAQRLTAGSGVQFEPADRSYKHLIELVTTGTATQLASDLSALFEAVQSCPAGGAVTITKLAIPALGDQRAAFAVSQGAAGGLYARTGYVRVGSHAVMLGMVDFQADAQARSRAADQPFLRLLQTAVAKLEG